MTGRSIILYNPHVDDFLGVPPHFHLVGRRAIRKYGFLLDAIHDAQGEVPVVVDGTVSVFIPARYFNILPRFARLWISGFEFRWWKRLTGAPGITRVSSDAEANQRSTLFAFSYKADGRHPEQARTFERFADVVFHLSHYFVYTERKAAFLRTVPNAWLAGDADISGNRYFQAFFDWYRRPFLTLPFAVGDRFVSRKLFAERSDHCVATGSVHDLSLEEPAAAYVSYRTVTGLDSYHLLRAELLEAKAEVSDVVDVRISPYRDYKARKGLWAKMSKYFSAKQKQHFAVDLVDLYNSYKFAVVGEEAAGFPALGMLEAMASGCAAFAKPDMLHGLGLEAGRHYLPYDGTLPGLLSAISDALGRFDVDKIASNGQEQVRRDFMVGAMKRRWAECLGSLGGVPDSHPSDGVGACAG